MECKGKKAAKKVVIKKVLIETYWNVKFLRENMLSQTEEPVLIETYWNVKQIILLKPVTGANVLIETYWNVKKKESMPADEDELSINRNILECKDDQMVR